MQRIKGSRGTKILAYILVGAFLFYMNAIEISYSQSKSPENYVREGKELYKKGAYEESLKRLERAEFYYRTIEHKTKEERLAEIYFYQGLNFVKQGKREIAKEMFKRAIRYAPGKDYNEELMDEEAEEIFDLAKVEYEAEFSPEAMGKPDDGDGGGSSAAWIVLAIVGIAAAGVLAYLLLKGKEEEKEKEPDVGSIQINSTPDGATIYLDNQNTGQTTPATLTNVSVGSHTVKLVKERYQDWETTVNVVKNQTATVNATLKPGSFTENFNDGKAQYWKKGEGEANWVVEGGVLKCKKGGYGRNSYYYNLASFSNYWTYEIKVKVATGRSTRALGPAFGGSSDFKVFYYLDVLPGARSWSVWKIDHGNPKNIKGWTDNNSINSGNAWNKLKVVANGKTFTFYANDKKLGEVTISDVPSKGKIGLCAWSTSDLDQTHFDNIKFTLQTSISGFPTKGEILTPRPASRPDADSGIR